MWLVFSLKTLYQQLCLNLNLVAAPPRIRRCKILILRHILEMFIVLVIANIHKSLFIYTWPCGKNCRLQSLQDFDNPAVSSSSGHAREKRNISTVWIILIPIVSEWLVGNCSTESLRRVPTPRRTLLTWSSRSSPPWPTCTRRGWFTGISSLKTFSTIGTDYFNIGDSNIKGLL